MRVRRSASGYYTSQNEKNPKVNDDGQELRCSKGKQEGQAIRMGSERKQDIVLFLNPSVWFHQYSP